jgi:glycosyltransferase involved in cell wall biosynthesis
MARVVAVKGPGRLVDIAKTIPEASFLLAGGGNLTDELKKVAPSNLTIVGWQSPERMWSVADIAISTSNNEGMPIALIEAQLAGIPVVAIGVGSIPEVIADQESGFVYQNFGEDFIDGVRKLVKNPKLRSKLGKKGKIFSSKNFDPIEMRNRHLDLFNKLL